MVQGAKGTMLCLSLGGQCPGKNMPFKDAFGVSASSTSASASPPSRWGVSQHSKGMDFRGLGQSSPDRDEKGGGREGDLA